MSGRQKGRVDDDRGRDSSAGDAVSEGRWQRYAERCEAAAFALTQERHTAATDEAHDCLTASAEAFREVSKALGEG